MTSAHLAMPPMHCARPTRRWCGGRTQGIVGGNATGWLPELRQATFEAADFRHGWARCRRTYGGLIVGP